MEQIGIVARNKEGKPEGGIDFFHTPGDSTYLYQVWEYKGSENIFRQTLPDPVMSDPEGKMSDLLYTVKNCWLEQVGMELDVQDTNYC